VTTTDIWLMAGLLAVTLVATAALYRPFLALAFNEQKAQLLGLRPRLAHIALLGLITLAIVASFQTVGTLLVFGLLVGPPATAALIVRRVPVMMAVAALIGVLSVVVGLIISFHANTSGSATMAVVPIVLFFAVLSFKTRRTRTGLATA
jgi:manganese/iron transport system permease protein